MSQPRPSLGTAQLASSYGLANPGREPSQDASFRVLRTAFERGIRSLDTAPEYGESEALIGRFLEREGRPDGLEICTKLPRLANDLSLDELQRTVVFWVERSRHRLAGDPIDYYLVRGMSSLEVYGQALVDALHTCEESNLVRQIGISIYAPEDAKAALGFSELSAIQYPFNVFDRRMQAGGLLETLREKGHVTFARSLLLQGLLTLDPARVPERLASARPWLEILGEICRCHEADPVPAALSYAAQRCGADYVVLGADSCDQLEALLGALHYRLPAGLAEQIDESLADVPLSLIDPRRWKPGDP